MPGVNNNFNMLGTEVLDKLAKECGEVIDNMDDVVTMTDPNSIEEVFKEYAKTNTQSYVYGDYNGPKPGQINDEDFNIAAKSNEESGIDTLVAKTAILKAKKEAENKKKLSAQEKAEIKKQVVSNIMYNQEEAFYATNHFMMDSKTRRRIKRIVERNYDKGMYGDPESNTTLNS